MLPNTQRLVADVRDRDFDVQPEKSSISVVAQNEHRIHFVNGQFLRSCLVDEWGHRTKGCREYCK
jgi:hypothetical protein